MPPASPESIAATLAAAAAAWSREVELVDDLSFSNRATVLRVAADGETAVAKLHVEERPRRAELTALQTLPAGTRPELLAHDDRVIVMSDLGDGPSLADCLLGDDASVAEAALVAWARTIGRIIAATIDPSRSSGVHAGALAPDSLEEFCSRVDLHVPDSVWHELDHARAALRTDAQHHAYVPSDVCPDNTRFDGSRMTLFDFEFSGWMHAAAPVSYLVVPFCSCWCLARLPEGMVDHLYAALTAEYPPAGSAEFREAVVRAGVTQVVDLLPLFGRWIEEDAAARIGRAPSTHRQRTITRLEWIAAQRAVMPDTAAFAGHLALAVRDRYPAPELPLYPAFRSL